MTDPRAIGDILKERRNIILKGADAATAQGFTQVPNFLLKSTKLSSGDKMAFAMLLSYAWQNDFCFPGQERLAKDLGLSDRSVRTHLKSLEAVGHRPTPRRHSLMQVHDELTACAPCLVASVLGWWRGVGRLRRTPVA